MGGRRRPARALLTDAAPDESDRSAPLPDVVVLDGHGPDHGTRLLEAQRLWPRARMVVLAVVGWPEHLREHAVRAMVRVTGRELRMTAEEVVALARQSGVELDEDAADAVLTATAGYCLYAAAVVRRAAEVGHLDDGVIASGCDRAMTDLAATAAADAFPGLAEVQQDAIRSLHEAEVAKVPDRPGAIGFPSRSDRRSGAACGSTSPSSASAS